MQRREKHITSNQLHESDYRWFAVYTKYRAEKWVCEALAKKGIEAYVPLVAETKQYQRKIKTYHKPLINCYAFVKINRSQYTQTLETEYLIRFLRQGKDLIAIPEEEINLLKRIVGEKLSINSHPLTLELGENVEIIRGKLTGLRGQLVEKKGKKEFIVALNNIGHQLSIGVNPINLRALSMSMAY